MQSISSALGPYRQFKAATFFTSSNRGSCTEADATSSSDITSTNGSSSPTFLQRSSTRQSQLQAASSVRKMMVRSPSSAQIQLLEERITCTDDLLDLVEPRPYYEACNNIGEVLFSRL